MSIPRSNVILLIATAALIAGCASRQFTTHRQPISHPGFSDAGQSGEIPLQNLVQQRSSAGYPEAFYLDVESVFCGDGLCKVVKVKLHWDELGNYQRYELAPGDHLEKDGGVLFNEEDHQKLHRILKDRKSPFRTMSLADIRPPIIKRLGQDELDGLTAATPSVARDASVAGAAWTSYTLWHWANGPARHTIRKITAATMDRKRLLRYLKEPGISGKGFAIDQFGALRTHDQEIADTLVAHLPANDRWLMKRTLAYLEQGPSELYYATVERLFEQSGTQARTQILNALGDATDTIPATFIDRFSHLLGETDSYQEVDMFLTLMEKRNAESPVVIDRAVALLNNPNFLIARRAFWYLGDRTLTGQQAAGVEQFSTKYNDRL